MASNKAKSDAERRERRLASRRKYNRSAKGKAATKRYEDGVAAAKPDTTPNEDALEELASIL